MNDIGEELDNSLLFRRKEYYDEPFIDVGKIKQRSRQKPKDYKKKKKAKRRNK